MQHLSHGSLYVQSSLYICIDTRTVQQVCDLFKQIRIWRSETVILFKVFSTGLHTRLPAFLPLLEDPIGNVVQLDHCVCIMSTCGSNRVYFIVFFKGEYSQKSQDAMSGEYETRRSRGKLCLVKKFCTQFLYQTSERISQTEWPNPQSIWNAPNQCLYPHRTKFIGW